MIFRPKKLKNLLLLIISSAFVAAGFFIIKDKSLMAWLIISFFGLGVLVSLIQFYPNASYLKLTDKGFEVRSLFKSSFTKWTHVKDFRKGSISGNQMIFFDYTEAHKKWRKGKQISKLLAGKEGAISSIYTISTDELIQLIQEFKSKSKE